jgi:uncharacterized membrane protein
MSQSEKKPICQICGTETDIFPAEMVRPSLAKFIKQQYPAWDSQGYICNKDLYDFRAKFIDNIIRTESKETRKLEKEVIKSLLAQDLISKNINTEFDEKLSFGNRLADKIASFGGSWNFIIIFGGVLFLWILINALVLLWKPFDPYPFILLNLILSCLAAIQAPIIMMSQNRQEAKDRIRAEHDYKINLKAELEIRYLHEKVDHLLVKQWERLLEIQQFQVEIMEEILNKKKA